MRLHVSLKPDLFFMGKYQRLWQLSYSVRHGERCLDEIWWTGLSVTPSWISFNWICMIVVDPENLLRQLSSDISSWLYSDNVYTSSKPFLMPVSGLFRPFLCPPGNVLRQPGGTSEKMHEGSVGRKEEGCQPFDRRSWPCIYLNQHRSRTKILQGA